MSTKRAGLISDIPTEGFVNKRVEVLLSPSQSEIESQIACADPLYVEEVRKEVETMQLLTKEKLRGRSLTDGQRRKSMKERTVEEVELGINTQSRDLFGKYTNALELLPFFHSYGSSILTDEEMVYLSLPALLAMVLWTQIVIPHSRV